MKFTRPYSSIKILLFIFFIGLVCDVFSQTINKTNFRIDTLKANWTSGTIPAQIKGEIYLSFKIPAGFTANLLMKSNPTGNYVTKGTFGDATSTATQRIRTKIPDLLVRVDIYCFYLELKNGSSTFVTKENCSIPFTKDLNNSPDNRIVFQVGSYQPGTQIPFNTFRPVIIGKCESVLGFCEDDEDTFATNTKTTSPYKARKEYNSFVICGVQKNYRTIIDIDGDGSMISISDTISYKGYTKQAPPALNEENVYASIENDKVRLFWKNDETTVTKNYTPESRFILERKDGNNAYKQVNLNTELVRVDNKVKWDYIDKSSKPSEFQYNYKLKYLDLCDNPSPETEVSPIFLSQDKKTFELNWSIENNKKVFDYQVEYFDLINVQIDQDRRETVIPKANKLKAKTFNFYRVRADLLNDGKAELSEEKKIYIYSNFIPNDENLTVLNPNVFTPDGKGPAESETFKVASQASLTFQIAIYDRYGLLVYYSDDYVKHRRDGWDGKLIYTDIDLPEGAYVFQVEVTNSNRRNFTKKGSVILIRN